jgi:hypothetical protein
LWAISGFVLVGCGGQNNDEQRAVANFNAAYGTVPLREAVKNGGGVSFCRIAPQPQRSGHLLLTAVMKNGSWLQATIDPDVGLRSEDITTGRDFAGLYGTKGEAELRERGKACRVSPDGEVSLD